MHVLLISDPGITRAGASLAVETGYFRDPPEYPGLAHFCEHLLFMGSEKYSEENLFFKTIAEYKGIANAYTSPNSTVYMYECNLEGLFPVMNIWAQFFHAPLLSASALKRERFAVHQEYLKSIDDDDRRFEFVLSDVANPRHPISKFSTGTKDTLPTSPEIVRSWYNQEYSPEKMHLVVYSHLPIQNIIDEVVPLFSIIPQKNPSLQSFDSINIEPMLPHSLKGNIIFIKSKQKSQKLQVLWEITADFVHDIQDNTLSLLTYALNNKGKHSFFQKLRDENLAKTVTTSFDKQGNSALLIISIDLTNFGMDHGNDIMQHLFETLQQLRSSKTLFQLEKELRAISLLKYQWQARGETCQFVSSLAESMIYEPLSTFPEKTLFPNYHQENVDLLLASLTPNKAVYFITLPEGLMPDEFFQQQDPWAKIPYFQATLDQEDDQWLSWVRTMNITQETADMLLPNNPFVPENVSLISTVQEPLQKHQLSLLEKGKNKCFFKQDYHYLEPRASLFLGIKSPCFLQEERSVLLGNLIIAHMKYNLTPIISFARQAGYSTSLFFTNNAIQVWTYGFPEKLIYLIQEIFHSFAHELPSKKFFDKIKEDLIDTCRRQDTSWPLLQARDLLLSIVQGDTISPKRAYEILHDVSYQEFLDFFQKARQSLYIEGLISGNINRTSAKIFWNHIKHILSAKKYDLQCHEKKKNILLPQNVLHLLEAPTEVQGDAALLAIQSTHIDPLSSATYSILQPIISEIFFDALRTQQQIGYLIKTWSWRLPNSFVLAFAVQSGTYPTKSSLSKIEDFIDDVCNNLMTYIPKDKFEKVKQSLQNILEKNPENLYQYTKYLYQLAFSQKGFLNHQQQQKALQELSYEDFINIIHGLLSKIDSKRMAILVSPSFNQNKEKFHQQLHQLQSYQQEIESEKAPELKET